MSQGQVRINDESARPGRPGVPRFCSRCGLEMTSDQRICSDCGDPLRDEAYCPVCERFWKLPPGTPCPKHDLPLAADPPHPAFDNPAGPSARWVTLNTYADGLQAEAPRLRLEAEGIPTLLQGSRMGSQSMYNLATGGVKLQVPAQLVAEARVLLDQSWSLPTDDDLDDAWDDLAPDPAAGRRRVMRSLICVILFGPLLLWLLARALGR